LQYGQGGTMSKKGPNLRKNPLLHLSPTCQTKEQSCIRVPSAQGLTSRGRGKSAGWKINRCAKKDNLILARKDHGRKGGGKITWRPINPNHSMGDGSGRGQKARCTPDQPHRKSQVGDTGTRYVKCQRVKKENNQHYGGGN